MLQAEYPTVKIGISTDKDKIYIQYTCEHEPFDSGVDFILSKIRLDIRNHTYPIVWNRDDSLIEKSYDLEDYNER